ncbi:MAG: 50S ribosomal protein L13 [Candidatus Zixiibacteriota bacterium]|nr:MAG: 50S ribosomal protein L13 [candidate division Zixibacteria bacterium]
MMRTFVPKVDSNARRWVVIDLQGATLGRAAVAVADILRGKDKPIFTPHLDAGDHVIAINASGLKVTGNKWTQKHYYRYSGYPGGLTETSLADQMSKDPTLVFKAAVNGMLPKNRLGRKVGKKLHVYAGADHPHVAQKPVKIELK